MSSKLVLLLDVPLGVRPFHMSSDKQGKDGALRFDAYVSAEQAYLFLDGSPYGCVAFPAGTAVPSGQVSVTWGHVLYHSGDDEWPFTNFIKVDGTTTDRIDSGLHYDNLGFSNGVPLPDWNYQRFPCETSLAD